MTFRAGSLEVRGDGGAVATVHAHHGVPAADLASRTVRGGVVRVCAQAAGFVLRIASLMILARLLEPSDFGLVNMVTVVTGVFTLFRDAGLSMVTVQRDSITEEQVSTLFWLNVLVGTILAGLSIAIAPGLVAFYREPRLFWVVVLLGTGFLFNALGVQHGALLQRRMRFAVHALIEVLSLVVSIAVGLGMAMAGFGYWALVGMAVSQPIASSAGVWVAAGWRPGLPRRRTDLFAMMRFGGAVTLNGLVVYFAYNLDKLLLGKFFGAEVLGIYGRAYQLVNIPTDNLHSSLSGVAYSSLSRLQREPERFRAYYVKGYSLFLGITVPITAACALFAPDVVAVVLGPKWSAAALYFRLLAPTIVAFAVINPLGWLLFSIGRVARSVKIAFVIAPVLIAAYAIGGYMWGPVGVALGFSATMMFLTVPLTFWATHGAPVSARDVFGAARPPVVAAACATVLALPVVWFLGGQLTPLIRLSLDAGLLVGAYVLLLLYPLGQKDLYARLFDQLIRPGAAPALS